jgi:hypothetical protein
VLGIDADEGMAREAALRLAGVPRATVERIGFGDLAAAQPGDDSTW